MLFPLSMPSPSFLGARQTLGSANDAAGRVLVNSPVGAVPTPSRNIFGTKAGLLPSLSVVALRTSPSFQKTNLKSQGRFFSSPEQLTMLSPLDACGILFDGGYNEGC